MRTLKTYSVIIAILAICSATLDAQVVEKTNFEIQHRHTVDFCPVSPMFGIWGAHYTYKLTPKDELITGVSYMNIKFEGIGETNSPALIFGYRRYLWKSLHVEYEIWPCYDDFWESNEKKYYSGFDIWNEFRVGYIFDFKVSGVPMFVNVQWPFGFGLYGSNKPDSFWNFQKDNKFFYFPPLVFLGLRF